MIETPIYARVEGYIRKRVVDIGSRVKKGDLMMELETPELDQQIRQSRAAISQARATLKQGQAQVAEVQAALKLTEITMQRWKRLSAEGVVSPQDSDEKDAQHEVKKAEGDAARANVTAAEESIRALEANLSRLEDMKSFSLLLAPFDGIVTYRNPDVGTLISPGATGRELFRVADISTVRAFVSIPQSYVPFIGPGIPGALTVEDIAGRSWPAPVKNISNSLDPATRTMLAVLYVQNPDLTLKPGMYARINFQLPSPPKSLSLPGDAVLARNDGAYVALLDRNHVVHYRKIEIARDFGSRVAISSGVSEGDVVVLSPGDEVREGQTVEIRTGKP